MTSEKLQRTSYRDPNTPDDRVRSGTTTLGENEQDMDQYYRPLERIHGSSLHGWGVASGLSVTATLNSPNPTLTIQPGVALDSNGEHIALAVGGNAEVGQTPTGFSTGATFVPVPTSGVVMPTSGLTGDKYLTIQFWETFDSDSYNNLGLFRYFHTPWVRLLDVAGFTNDGSRLVLAKASFGTGATAGQVTALTQDLRQATDLPVGSMHLQRSMQSTAAGNVTVATVEAGVLQSHTTGGLDIRVPNASDEIHLERDDGTNCAKVSLGAEKIVARQGSGTESVVIDTEAGSVTASGAITTSGNISANNGTVSASNVTATGTIQGGSITSTGNVGIGTTGSSAKLEVDGQTYINNTSPPGVVSVNQLSFNEHGANWGHFYGDGNNRLYFGGSDALTTVPSSPMMTWDLSNGYVGIGTSTPSATLNIDPQGSGGIVIGNPNTGQGGFTSLLLDISAASGGYARLQAIKASGTEWGDLVLNPDGGNVSIATNGALNASSITATGVNATAIATSSLTVTNDIAAGGSVNAYTATIYNAGNQHAAYLASDCCAAWFTGNVHIDGTLSKSGGGFQIDHPTAPGEKFLNHSFVESSEMKNLYDGIAVLDANGEAVVELPAWFEPLNSDFRYQLTPLGAPGPNLYIAQEIANHHFSIAGGTPSMRVSWQVTAIRQDTWAKAHPMQVEEEKSAKERGYFLHPELHDASAEKNIAFVLHPQSVQKVMESKKDS